MQASTPEIEQGEDDRQNNIYDSAGMPAAAVINALEKITSHSGPLVCRDAQLDWPIRSTVILWEVDWNC